MLEEVRAHFYKHYKIMSRRAGDLAWVFVHPFVALFSIGILAHFLIIEGAPLDSLIYVLVGVIAWNFYDVSQRAMAFGVTLDIWNNCMKHTFSVNSSIKHFILGNSLFGLASSIVTFVLVTIAAWISFGLNLLDAGIFLPVNLFFVFVFATGVGLMIDSLMVSKGEKYMSLMWIGTGIIMVLSGVYYPVSVLPGPVGMLSSALPSTHSIEAMRLALQSLPGQAVMETLYGAALSLVFFLAGVLLFRKGLRKGKENGVITKY